VLTWQNCPSPGLFTSTIWNWPPGEATTTVVLSLGWIASSAGPPGAEKGMGTRARMLRTSCTLTCGSGTGCPRLQMPFSASSGRVSRAQLTAQSSQRSTRDSHRPADL
jgi:hypothetical protein